MNIEIEIEHGADIASGVDIEGITQYVLEQEGCPATTEVSITLTTDEEVHRLNKEYRGIDRPTDVLSFECDGLDDDFDGGAAYDDAGVPDDEPFMLGDIIIASDYARAQTAQFGTTPQEELAVLLVHGLLHLCGWDHVHSDEEAEAMEAREREMLAGVGLPNIRLKLRRHPACGWCGGRFFCALHNRISRANLHKLCLLAQGAKSSWRASGSLL